MLISLEKVLGNGWFCVEHRFSKMGMWDGSVNVHAESKK